MLDTIIASIISFFLMLMIFTNVPNNISDPVPVPETIEYVEETTTAEVIVPSYIYSFTPEEEDLLVRTAYFEARGEGVEGMALIMNVIINRRAYSGLSIHDVIYSPGQFAVVDILYTATPSPEAYQALDMVKLGWDSSQGALYFCTPAANSWHRRSLTYLFTYKNTEFYR